MQEEVLQDFPISETEDSWAIANTKKLFAFAQLQKSPQSLCKQQISDDIEPNFSYSSINAV